MEFNSQSIALYEPGTLKIKENVQYSEISAFTITVGYDGFIILRLPTDTPGAKVGTCNMITAQ